MNGIWKINLLLATVVAALLVINLWPEDNPYQPLTSIDQGNIRQITLTGPNRQLSLTRQDSWQLANAADQSTADQSAPGDKVDSQRVDELLGILRTHSYRDFPATGDNRENFGLITPQYRLKLNELIIDFGSVDPAQQLRYVQVGERVHLITDRYLEFFLVDEKFFLPDPE